MRLYSSVAVAFLLLSVLSHGLSKDKVSIRRDPGSATVRIVLDHSSVIIAGRGYGEPMLRYDPMANGVAAVPGMPDLPMRTLLIPLPSSNSHPRVTRLTVTSEPLAPFQVSIFTIKDSTGQPIPVVDEHRAGNTFPESPAKIADVLATPSGRLAKLVYFPLLYDLLNRTGRRILSLECVITWDDQAGVASPMKRVMDRWYLEGIPYLAMAVSRDGPIRIGGEELHARGFTRAQLDGMRVYYRGQEMPILVNGGGTGPLGAQDEIYFMGSKNYSSNRVPGEYSDTSVFWLTSIGSFGKRFQPAAMSFVAAETVSVAKDTLRFEEDRIYYPGNGVLTFQNLTEKNDGEGWYWARLQGNQQTTLTFSLSSVVLAPATEARLVVRLQGSTAPPADSLRPDHVIQISLNGQVLDTIRFSGYEEKFSTFAFPVSRLQQGNNNVRLSNLRSLFNEVLVDFVEVQLVRQLILQDNALLFSGESATGAAIFRISNLPDTSITVLKLSPTALRLTNLRFESQGTTYTLLFPDSVQDGSRYLVFSSSAAVNPDRMWVRTFGDILTPARDKEYLIITHSLFEPAAMRLGQYRSRERNSSFAVVRVEDLYDYYSDGEFDPVALKRFLKEVYETSAQPPSYLLLMGDANWDYKNRRQTQRRNFVPSYGFPVSDAWFSGFDSVHVFYPYLHTGRLPVRTLEEANRVVDKIIRYDVAPFGVQSKRFMIMTAGITDAESNFFKLWAEDLFQRYVLPAPTGGEPVRVYSEAGIQLDFSAASRVKQALDSGATWINYLGHGGTTLWGNGITSPSQLNNREGKSMLVTDLSCSTVRFAEPDVESLSEQMLFDDGGSVAFMGMSGFGFLSALSTIGTGIYQVVLRDSIREFGKALTAAKLYTWRAYGESASNLVLRSTMAQYTLLGDPAQKFRLPLNPELKISDADVSIQPSEPTESEEGVSVRLAFWNFGLIPVDSAQSTMQVRIQHFRESALLLDTILIRLIPNIRDTVMIGVPIRALTGEHVLRVRLVLPATLVDHDTTNNSVDYRFYVYSNQIAILKPPLFQEVPGVNIALTVQNPSRTQQTDYRVFFELDTIPNFSSSWKINQSVVPGFLVTQWPIAQPLEPREYFWRARTADGQVSPWVNGNFLVSAQPMRYSWSQLSAMSFASSRLTNVDVTNSGVRLRRPRIPVTVVSGGHCNGGTAAVSLGGTEVLANLAKDGYNVVAVDKHTGEVVSILSPGAFWRGDATTKALAIGNLIKSQPEGTYFLVAVMDEGGLSKPDTMNRAMEAIGSNMIRSVNLWDSWAIIGRKGAPKGSVPEGIKHAYPYVVAPDGAWQCNPETPESLLTPTVLHDTLQIFPKIGTILSPVIGPAKRWKSLVVNVDTTQPGTSFRLDLIRIRSDGSSDTVRNIPLSDSSLASLVDASEFPYLQLLGMLLDDDGEDSPVLHAWKVDFERPPNLALNYQSVIADRESVLEGEAVHLRVGAGNVGYSPVDSARLEFWIRRPPGSEQLLASVPLGSIAVDSVRNVDFVFNSTGYRGPLSLIARVFPQTLPYDLSNRDNQFSLSLTVLPDTIRPSLDVTFDGVRIFDGDYVSAQPTIQAVIYDNSPLPINDPNVVVLRLNNRRITLGATPDSLFQPGTGAEKARVVFRPSLTKGEHVLSLQVYDATGNPVDTAAREFRFRVEPQSRLLNVLNIPNPFVDETHFTFNLVGSKLPDELVIKIYTVSGRLIQELRVPRPDLRFGFNRVRWDGRDRDGDPVANGVYLYKIVMNIDGRAEEVIQKLARVK